MSMNDNVARRAALDTNRSFVVQAPAGSGKTELLIQRYLALLAKVDLPEQIIAITYTRKAALEMRSRILASLDKAKKKKPAQGSHERQTRNLALAVLARNQKLSWDIQNQPKRLRVDTVDALNAWLAQRLPILSGGVAGAQVKENVDGEYREATERTVNQLSDLGELGKSLGILLHRLDNRLSQLELLLVQMLPRRDQWLRYLAVPSSVELRKVLEKTLQEIILEKVTSLAKTLSGELSLKLLPLLSHSARFAGDSVLRAKLEPWKDRKKFPAATPECLDLWQGISHLFLTKAGNWRKRLTVREGFGPKQAEDRGKLREVMKDLKKDDECREQLCIVRDLPKPQYDESQWEALSALRVVLRHLAAELQVVFDERNVVDFVEIAMAAQRALGQVDNPSDLLLALDQRVQHLLVDEFQDTSHSQHHLLELLTAGWEPEDGRTLFLVGDPMQSIYRFRDADPSLFLKTMHRSLGSVTLKSLELAKNFRSSPEVVDWVNRAFQNIFPPEDNLIAGMGRFHASLPDPENKAVGKVSVHALRGDDPNDELSEVMEILGDELNKNEHCSVGILVRSRSHLRGLHDQLRSRGFDVHAVEIDAPNQTQVVQDLIGLTRALTHLGDRIAWLGILRAPWCGLSWQDLHTLAFGNDRKTVWQIINDEGQVEKLSSDGQQRLTQTRGILQLAFRLRAEQSLARWVERTWVSLGGPACLDFTGELDQSDRFFQLLDEFSVNGDLDDPLELDSLLSEPWGQGEPPRQTGIEVMTIHRAKGLEFDTVILLGLGRRPRPPDPKALYWMERIGTEETHGLLMAPLMKSPEGKDPLIEFVRREERTRDASERARLLYVATTRARNDLHLIVQLRINKKEPPKGSLAALVWVLLMPNFELEDLEIQDSQDIETMIQPKLRRLAKIYSPDLNFDPLENMLIASRPDYQWAGQSAIHVGTVVHAWLQRISDQGLEGWTTNRILGLKPRFNQELELMGVDSEDLDQSTARVVRALLGVLEDPRGRWVLGDHLEASSELSVTYLGIDGLGRLRIDRTFVDEGTRWIIDFKTSYHEGGSLENFLDSEVARYRSQLTRYAEVLSKLDSRPIRMALYFPIFKAFRDWENKEAVINN